jgi:branched-subunit amino acid transport protein
MHFGKEIVKKKKKALLGLAAGTLMSALVAIPLYILTGQALTLTILGLGAGIGFSVGGGFDLSLDSD